MKTIEITFMNEKVAIVYAPAWFNILQTPGMLTVPDSASRATIFYPLCNIKRFEIIE